jgi:hypothetical protein
VGDETNHHTLWEPLSDVGFLVVCSAQVRNFPLNELLSATDLDEIQDSLMLIFGHISRKL